MATKSQKSTRAKTTAKKVVKKVSAAEREQRNAFRAGRSLLRAIASGESTIDRADESYFGQRAAKRELNRRTERRAEKRAKRAGAVAAM